MSWTPDIVLLKVELANLDAFASKVDFNERRKMGKTSDKTVYKTTGWCGFGSGSNTAAVDTKDGRIARIRPLHLDDKYTMDELNP